MEKKQDSLIKITDLTARLGLSSRSLRYYEQVGLIKSYRTGFDKYRYYNEENIERLKQIMVLRKMQIPIKDILRIYENEDMSVVVDIFVKRINSIDDEIGALEELKGIISDFLRFMQKNGVTKISVIPILYEEMEKQFELLEREKTVSYNDLSKLSERLAHPVDPAIISLPPMRVVSSLLKENPKESDTEGFWRWLQEKGLKKGAPGDHMQFEYQLDNVEVILQRIPDDYANDGIYYDFVFDGGLFASVNVFLDEDLAECFQYLIKSFDDNKFYMIDYTHSGELRYPALLESLISPDVKRELVALLIPVKKRTADSSLFSLPEEQTDISVNDIEAANPVLWELNLSPDKLIQTHKNFSDYHINDDGEGEYISRVIRAILKTNVSVKLPFRVDIEFRQSGQGKQESFSTTVKT